MNPTTTFTSYCQQLALTGLAAGFESLIEQVQLHQPGYVEYANLLLETELTHRRKKELERRLKDARLPLVHDLEVYDESFQNGLSPAQFNQLKELTWLDQNFNLVLMGPSGTGKSFIAAGLCHHAIKMGYKGYFRTIDQIIDMLKMKDLTRTAMADFKRLTKAHLLVIDDIMLFPVAKTEAAKLFGFINQLFERTSLIITTNKAPQEWPQMLDDEVLATALLDRILFRCQVIKLSGKSFRLLNRKSIFEN